MCNLQPAKRLCLGKNLTGDSTCPSTRDGELDLHLRSLYNRATNARTSHVCTFLAQITNNKGRGGGHGFEHKGPRGDGWARRWVCSPDIFSDNVPAVVPIRLSTYYSRGIIHGFREKLKNSGITMPLGIFSTSLFYILSKKFNPGQIFIWTAEHSNSSIQVFTGSLVFI